MSPMCTIEIRTANSSILNNALLDTGSSISLCPLSLLTADMIKVMDTSAVNVHGIAGRMETNGKLQCDVILGHGTRKSKFTNHIFHVTNQKNIPILIGMG